MGYQKPAEAYSSSQSTNAQSRMNSKTLQNMNRISNYQRQQMNPNGPRTSMNVYDNPSQPSTNQWFSNFDMNRNLNTQDIYPSFQMNMQNQNVSNFNQSIPTSNFNQSIPTSNYNQSIPPTNFNQSIPTSNFNQSVPPTNYNQSIPTSNYNQSVPTSNYNQSIPPTNFNQSIPTSNYNQSIPHSAIASVRTTQSVQTGDVIDSKDPMKYFPPGTRKKTQNVPPQTVESKFSA